MFISQEEFDGYFDKVRPIIFKTQSLYHIKLWDGEDWLQEGRIILWKLLSQEKQSRQDNLLLYRYFKTAYTNHVKDQIRHQTSQKRQLNQEPYLDIGEIAHRIPGKEIDPIDYLSYQEAMADALRELGAEVQDKIELIIADKRFKGKKHLLKQLRPYFISFEEDGSF